LLLVVGANSPGARDLIDLIGAAVVVGDPGPLAIPTNLVAAFIEPPLPTMGSTAPAAEAALGTSRRPSPVRAPSPVLLPSVGDDAPTLPTEPSVWKKRLPLLAGGLLAAIAGGWFLMGRPGTGGPQPDLRAQIDTPGPSSNMRVGLPAPARADSAAALNTQRTTDSLRALVPANAADSARATPYSVVLLTTADEAMALAQWVEKAEGLAASTVTMTRIRGERGRNYQLHVGAFARATSADSLLRALRTANKIRGTDGRMVAAPYAIELERVQRRVARNVADGYIQRQIAAYPMQQPDGLASVFVGAFETPEAAAPMLAELKQKGFSGTLKYRTGRSL
jgi:hypothetical protein